MNIVPPTLDYRSPSPTSKKVSLAVVSLAVFGAAASIVAACAVANPPLPVLGVGLFGAVALTGIGELLALAVAVFGSRHRRLATLGFFLNAAGLILLLWEAVNG